MIKRNTAKPRRTAKPKPKAKPRSAKIPEGESSYKLFLRDLFRISEQIPKDSKGHLDDNYARGLGRMVTEARKIVSSKKGNLSDSDVLAIQRGQKAAHLLAIAGFRAVLPMAKGMERTYGRITGLERQDFVQEGAIGSIKAGASFNPDKFDRKFITHASPRIRGAMIDGIRNFGTRHLKIPKRIFISGKIARITADLQKKLGRHPTQKEIYAEMEARRGEIFPTFLSLEEPAFFPERGFGKEKSGKLTLKDAIPDRRENRPDVLYFKDALGKKVQVGIGRLSEQQQQVIRGIYYEEKTMKEIGQEMGVSESRVCQVHAEAVQKMGHSGELLARYKLYKMLES